MDISTDINNCCDEGSYSVRASIHDACPTALGQIVSLHESSFPGFLMTLLGSGFLRIYYETALEYPGTISLIARDAGNVVGFVVGYLGPHDFYSLLRRRWRRLAMAAAKGLLLAPGLLPRVLGNMRSIRRLAQCIERPDVGAELASIGVLPKYSGQGLGKALVKAFVERARANAAKYVYLTTGAVDNDKVNGFYFGLGFTCSKTFLAPGGRLMNEYVLLLENECSTAPKFQESRRQP
jgi:ribosomal protein S18 acetylase RimI-like enzyme